MTGSIDISARALATQAIDRAHLAVIQNALLRAPCRFPPVMAEPPTINKGADFASSTIPSAQFIPVPDPRMGCHFSELSTVNFTASHGGRDVGFYTNPGPAPQHMVFSLMTDADQVDLLFSRSQRVQFLIDGKRASAAPFEWTVNGSTRYIVSLHFTSAEMREISFNVGSMAGAYIGPTYSMAPGRISGAGAISISAVTDSYGSKPGSQTKLAMQIGMLLGCSGVQQDTLGGTGYAQSNASDPAPEDHFLARSTPGHVAQQSFAEWNSDIDFVLGGINDLPSLTVDQVRSVLLARRALFPRAIIIAGGNWWPDPTATRVASTKFETIQTVIDQAISSLPGPWVLIDNIHGEWRNSAGVRGSTGGEPWQTGAGTESMPTGVGNGDIYIADDGTHPTMKGVDYLSVRLAETARTAILAL
ncbi:hypothetical protein D6851_11060 [Altericroceibacterium spongiae]|uniref:SGNH hydrolase-type esterase domain-containing protein n=1 Tax=Altericroceibacterium spongiae TaxID=2320269 RepID=A0A420EJ37_9SPHN|nr:hypothetical protein [Altericroceibacterium spongiae]RKF20663.1 hypothetical protein D6851_11060 [Altericroceibacterium spongiae]